MLQIENEATCLQDSRERWIEDEARRRTGPRDGWGGKAWLNHLERLVALQVELSPWHRVYKRAAELERRRLELETHA